jgi:hypothetical protein
MVLREMHNVPYVGHPGYQKQLQLSRANIFGQV